ncbi:MAG: RHS repeat-associated core domain-containing protein, partial [Bacteroidales bacterium]|nr:RHS repeat-associated core domain-containing protein [Bacteroidales bacterium]
LKTPMPTAFTYSPHISQTRTKCPRTYGVRVCPCAAFATDTCRPTACMSLAQPPAVPCPLSPAPWMFTFSAKEKDTETGLSYFGSRYYSSDLSIWLSVDPMSDKYPSLSPYVYCANNPVKLVDPNGEEISNPDDPPKNNNLFQRGWEAFKRFDQSLEGHSDCANQGTVTKQDVEVGVAVVATMMSAGAALEAETAFKTTVAVASAVNSVDDATVNSSGQTVSQKATANNKTASNAVKGVKTAVSVSSAGVSANNVRKVIVEAAQKGTQVIKKNASTIAKNVAGVATSVYGAVTSLFKKKK